MPGQVPIVPAEGVDCLDISLSPIITPFFLPLSGSRADLD